MFVLTYLSCREVGKSVCAVLVSGHPGTLAIVNHAVHMRVRHTASSHASGFPYESALSINMRSTARTQWLAKD